jgi:hypothetical protein
VSVHTELKETASQAISALHGDTSVSKRQTVESLEELQSDLEMFIAAVKEDIENEIREAEQFGR